MAEGEKRYWFPAKSRGWGWGLPITWKGWVVFVAYLAAVLASALFATSRVGLLLFLVVVFVLSALFILVCWLKGEPPEWR